MRVLVESLRRLYQSNKIDTDKVIELFKKGKITDEERFYILDVRNA